MNWDEPQSSLLFCLLGTPGAVSFFSYCAPLSTLACLHIHIYDGAISERKGGSMMSTKLNGHFNRASYWRRVLCRGREGPDGSRGMLHTLIKYVIIMDGATKTTAGGERKYPVY